MTGKGKHMDLDYRFWANLEHHTRRAVRYLESLDDISDGHWPDDDTESIRALAVLSELFENECRRLRV
jgi:hypothetical protein